MTKLTRQKQIVNSKIQFHSYWKAIILKVVKDCTYVAFEQYNNKFFLKIRAKDTKEIVFELTGCPDDMTVESYQNLIKQIVNEQV